MAETVGLPLFSLSINFLFWAFASSSAKFVGCAFVFGADFQIYGGVCLCDGIQRGQRMESRTLASSSIDFFLFFFISHCELLILLSHSYVFQFKK